jgi:hypothetical protein
VAETAKFKVRQLVRLKHDTVFLRSLLALPAGSVGIVTRLYADGCLIDVRFLDIRNIHAVSECELEAAD